MKKVKNTLRHSGTLLVFIFSSYIQAQPEHLELHNSPGLYESSKQLATKQIENAVTWIQTNPRKALALAASLLGTVQLARMKKENIELRKNPNVQQHLEMIKEQERISKLPKGQQEEALKQQAIQAQQRQEEVSAKREKRQAKGDKL